MKIHAWYANAEAIRSLWAHAAEKSKVIEKDGEWILKYQVVHRDITGSTGHVWCKCVIGKSIGNDAITEAEAWRIAEGRIVSKLRENSLPPPEPIDLRAKVESMRLMPDDSPDWLEIMENVFDLPFALLPFVQSAVKARRWIQAYDPVEAVRRQTLRRLSKEGIRCHAHHLGATKFPVEARPVGTPDAAKRWLRAWNLQPIGPKEE